MPRPGPKRRGVSFRAAETVLDEIQAAADAAAKRLKRPVTRTEIMQARNEYAARDMPQQTLDRWLIAHEK